MNRKISSAGSRGHLGFRPLITLIGDLGTILATVTVVVNTPLPVTAVLVVVVVVLAAAALLRLAAPLNSAGGFGTGRRLERRRTERAAPRPLRR